MNRIERRRTSLVEGLADRGVSCRAPIVRHLNRSFCRGQNAVSIRSSYSDEGSLPTNWYATPWSLVFLLVIACASGSSPATSSMVTATTEPQLLQVPDVVGEDEAFARGLITGVGLTVEVSTVPSGGAVGVVSAQAPVGGEMVREATVVQLVVSEAEITTTTKRTTTTVGIHVNDHDVVASIRRISDEIQRVSGIPTWVVFRTDVQLIDYMKGFCTSSDSIGIYSTVTPDVESITETAESGHTAVAMTQLMTFVAVWQSAANNYCPEHSREVQEIVDQLQVN